MQSFNSVPFRAAAICIALSLVAGSTFAQREARKAPDATATPARFVYKADGKRLVEVLQDFAASRRVPAVVAEGVEGVVSANFDTSPEKFLDAIAKAYGVLYYFDGTAYFFYPAKAIQSKLFRLKGYSKNEVAELLNTLGLGDKRFPLKFDSAQRTLLVYGPPRHVELVAQALDSLDIGASEGNQVAVRVFPLRFASAADRQMGDTLVPGVVSTLRGLYGKVPDGIPQDQGAANSSGRKPQIVQPAVGVNRLVPDLPSASHGAPHAADKVAGREPTRGLRSPVSYDDDAPRFEADEGTNAVIVHGRAFRMAEYEALVRRLDQKPLLVELEAMIIDVSADDVDALGIDWSLQGRRGAISVNRAGQQPGDPVDPLSALTTGMFNVNTVLADAGRRLLANVTALQGQGKARIISKPSVLGVVNRPAVMKEKRVASVRVAGHQDVKLFQVEAGTLLQVTPQVVTANGINQIKLALYIEDGNFEKLSVDAVPVVKRTEIRTEAHVKEGESLLIGGLVIETEESEDSGVPGLRRIPLLGSAFNWKSNRTSRAERLFLITPRVIDGTLVAAGSLPVKPPAAPQPAAQPAMTASVLPALPQSTAWARGTASAQAAAAAPAPAPAPAAPPAPAQATPPAARAGSVQLRSSQKSDVDEDGIFILRQR